MMAVCPVFKHPIAAREIYIRLGTVAWRDEAGVGRQACFGGDVGKKKKNHLMDGT
jgi:hypothetical protein